MTESNQKEQQIVQDSLSCANQSIYLKRSHNVSNNALQCERSEGINSGSIIVINGNSQGISTQASSHIVINGNSQGSSTQASSQSDHSSSQETQEIIYYYQSNQSNKQCNLLSVSEQIIKLNLDLSPEKVQNMSDLFKRRQLSSSQRAQLSITDRMGRFGQQILQNMLTRHGLSFYHDKLAQFIYSRCNKNTVNKKYLIVSQTHGNIQYYLASQNINAQVVVYNHQKENEKIQKSHIQHMKLTQRIRRIQNLDDLQENNFSWVILCFEQIPPEDFNQVLTKSFRISKNIIIIYINREEGISQKNTILKTLTQIQKIKNIQNVKVDKLIVKSQKIQVQVNERSVRSFGMITVGEAVRQQHNPENKQNEFQRVVQLNLRNCGIIKKLRTQNTVHSQNSKTTVVSVQERGNSESSSKQGNNLVLEAVESSRKGGDNYQQEDCY